MIIKSIKDEDKIPFKEIIKAVRLKMKDVIRVVDALDLGRTQVKVDGVYRTFNNGNSIKLADGEFKKKKLASKRIKLF